MNNRQMKLLQAVADLQPDAYGVTIQDRTGISLTTIYSELEKLEAEYMVGSQQAPGAPERGYRRRMLWSLTPVGRRAITASPQSRE